ncbi:hypothetical protein VPH35_088991 [Triticum aestivum]
MRQPKFQFHGVLCASEEKIMDGGRRVILWICGRLPASLMVKFFCNDAEDLILAGMDQLVAMSPGGNRVYSWMGVLSGGSRVRQHTRKGKVGGWNIPKWEYPWCRTGGRTEWEP